MKGVYHLTTVHVIDCILQSKTPFGFFIIKNIIVFLV